MREADLIADVAFYRPEAGGKTIPIASGYGCPCLASKTERVAGWDARLVFDGEPILPGERRRVGFVFLTRDGAEAIRSARHFFLWEGRFVGEATVCDD